MFFRVCSTISVGGARALDEVRHILCAVHAVIISGKNPLYDCVGFVISQLEHYMMAAQIDFFVITFFFVINNFYFIFSHTTQHIQNKTKQNSRHILNISRFNQKGGREGRTTRTQKSLL